MPIQLLLLPYLAQKEILENLELSEKIQLSATSTRAANLFRSIKSTVDSLEMTITKDSVELVFPDYDLEFQFFYEKPLKNFEDWTINGSPLPVQANQKSLKFSLGAPKKIKKLKNKMEHVSRSLETVLLHLIHILKIQNIDVRTQQATRNIPDYVSPRVSAIFTHLKSIQFREVELWKELKPDDCAQLLELVTAQKLMICYPSRGKCNQKYQNVRQLPIENLEMLWTGNWMDFSNAPNVKNIQLFLMSRFLESGLEAANLFIKSWITGSHRFVENLKVKGGSENAKKTVLKRVKSVKTQLTVQHLNTIHQNHDGKCLKSSRHANDILRKSDGLRATVICCSQQTSVMVWTRENLEKIGRV